MVIKIYKSYGVLSHEKRPFYSAYTPASDIYDIIKVFLPCDTWRNCIDDIGVTLDGCDYLLHEVLTNWGEEPALVWVDGHVKKHIVLDVIE